MNKISIYPSLISADLLQLKHVIDSLEPYCQGFHIDVMDNHFVPNLTWGPMFVNAIAAYASKPLFVHFMTDNPAQLIQQCNIKPQSIVSFHFESKIETKGILNFLKEKKLISSLAISPKTAIQETKAVLKYFDQVLLMSVNPGYSGQQFLPTTFQRLEELVALRQQEQLRFEIAVDGGVNEDNIAQLANQGARLFCIASAIFAKPDPIIALQRLYNLAGNKN